MFLKKKYKYKFILYSRHRSSFEDVKKFHGEVESAAVRLEELLLQKKKKIIQAARVRALETETHEVIRRVLYNIKIKKFKK